MFADDVSEDRSTVEIDAGRYARRNRIGRRKGDIVRRREARKPTDRVNGGEG